MTTQRSRLGLVDLFGRPSPQKSMLCRQSN